MITDERITELWNLASNTATSKPDWTYSEIIFATVRAVIAEHDAELRKQEPVAWMARSGSGTTVLPDERMNKDYYNIPLYTAPIPTPSQQEPVPKGFIVVSKDLLAEAIACNTDASLAEARHIINSVLKVSDDEIFREVLKEESK